MVLTPTLKAMLCSWSSICLHCHRSPIAAAVSDSGTASPQDPDANNRRIQTGNPCSNVLFVHSSGGAISSTLMHTHPGQDIQHELHPVCSEHCVPYRELNTAAKHVLNSNTWVILLMISLCLSALLDLSQSALCLAKLSSKWDKTSPMCWRQGKDVTPTCSCQEWMIGWSGGEHALCKTRLVLYWSKSSPTSHYKTNHSFLIPNNRITHILVPAFASILILQKSLESLYCWNPYARRKYRQGICIILPCFPTTWLSVVLFCTLMLLKTIQGKAKIWSVKVTDQWQCESVRQQQKIKRFFI